MSVRNIKTLARCIVEKLKELYPVIKPALTYDKPHEFLFAVILSAQTTDVQVNKVTPSIFKKYKNLSDYANASVHEFEKDISSIGLYKAKSKSIVQAARMLINNHGEKIPDNISELVKLPGVGRKTANVVLAEIYNISEGIAVDTHVKRLAKKYGLTQETDPVKIERDLMEIIPKSQWGKFALRLIQYGRDYCPANCKKCPNCPLWECVKP